MKKIVLLSLLIVVLAAFFASAHPDGLEKVAATLGFIGQGTERTSMLTDYTVPFVSSQGLTTALAGATGVFMIIGMFWGMAFVLRKK
ncbi:PDGLE domain-containing protein [Candidatus Margulisiibacteriota bacterium]